METANRKKAIWIVAAIAVLVTCTIFARNSALVQTWMQIRHHRNELAFIRQKPHRLPQQQWRVHAETLVELGYFFKQHYACPLERREPGRKPIWDKVQQRDRTVMSVLDRYSQLPSDQALIGYPDDSGRISLGRTTFQVEWATELGLPSPHVDVTPLLGDFVVYDLADRQVAYDAVFKPAEDGDGAAEQSLPPN